MPDFRRLMSARHNACAWCFDLLAIDDRDLKSETLVARKEILRGLLKKADLAGLRYSEGFADAAKLLAAAEELGIEGIVSKRKEQEYICGRNPGWVKVKTARWREANRERWKLFERV